MEPRITRKKILKQTEPYYRIGALSENHGTEFTSSFTEPIASDKNNNGR